MMRMLLVTAGLWACSGSKQDRCQPAFDHVKTVASAELEHQDLPANGKAAIAGSIAHESEVGVESCRSDKWGAEAVACLESAPTSQAITACFQKLPPAQLDAYNKASVTPATPTAPGKP
jgi:hypothetical protein